MVRLFPAAAHLPVLFDAYCFVEIVKMNAVLFMFAAFAAIPVVQLVSLFMILLIDFEPFTIRIVVVSTATHVVKMVNLNAVYRLFERIPNGVAVD